MADRGKSGGQALSAGVPFPANQPAISSSALLQMLALVLDVPLVCITEFGSDGSCVVGALHDRLGTGLQVGDRIAREDAVCTAVLIEQALVVIPDAELDPTVPAAFRKRGLRSFAGVPLARPDEPPFAALWVAGEAPRQFSQANLSLLMQTGPLLADGLLKTRELLADLRRHAHAVASMRENLVVTDLAGIIQYVNPATEATFGWPAEKLIGQNFTCLGRGVVSEELAGEVLEKSMGEGFSGHMPNVTADGRKITVWLTTNVIKDESGRPYLLMGLSHDVTAQLEAENRLRTTTQLLQALYEASADGILMLGNDKRVLVANRRFGEFFGFDSTACVGKSDVELRTAAFSRVAEPEAFERRVLELNASPDMESEDELTLVAPLPRCLQRYSGPVRDEEGRVLGRLWIFRDVTARRAMEQELRKSKLELEEKARVISEADRLKSEFLAATSHDLRTPLNSLLGFLKLVLEDACRDRAEERQLLRHASDAGNHLLSLLNDILDLAKIETGKVLLSLGPVDLRGLLLELEPVVAVQARAKSLEFRTQLPDGPPILVHSDYQRLRQALLNLIGNAVKYTLAGTVSVRLDPSSPAGQVRVTVTDTGIGMDQQTLEAARSGQVSSRGARGAGGLGLAIARRFVGLMAGTVNFDSPGLHQGTTVTVELPAVTQASPGCAEKLPSSADGSETAPAASLRVLMVEDDPATAHALSLALQRLGGCQVTVSEDVPTILGLAASGRIDIVLMDVSLVRSYYQGRLVDGLDVTRLLKSDARTRSLPVVLMTAYAMAGDRERMLAESGADDYEAKPVMDFRLLMSRLRRHCG